jgi:hypothetical protein
MVNRYFQRETLRSKHVIHVTLCDTNILANFNLVQERYVILFRFDHETVNCVQF